MTSWLRVAPAFLDPILALVERIDRRLRRLRPIRSGGVLWLEQRRHRGAPLTLRDGALIHAGDLIGILHFHNRRLREIATPGWLTEGFALARADLAALAAWHRERDPDEQPVAYGGVTILAALIRRVGFEVHERPSTLATRLEDWYLRSLLVRWSTAGRARLGDADPDLRAVHGWMSAGALERRYGPAAQ